MAAATKPTRKNRRPEPLKIYSVSLTSADAGVLATLAQAASDQLGRSISMSAVLRGMLRLVSKKILPEPAIIETIEQELAAGRKWGKAQAR